MDETRKELVRLWTISHPTSRNGGSEILFLFAASSHRVRFSESTYLLILATAQDFSRISIHPAAPKFCNLLTSEADTCVVLSDLSSCYDASEAVSATKKRKRLSWPWLRSKPPKKWAKGAQEEQKDTASIDYAQRNLALLPSLASKNLDDIEAEADVAACFMHFLEACFAEENWMFLKRVVEWFDLNAAEQRRHISLLLRDFVDEDAEHRVNLSGGLYLELRRAHDTNDLIAVRSALKKAKAMISMLLHQNYGHQFVASRALYDCLRQRPLTMK